MTNITSPNGIPKAKPKRDVLGVIVGSAARRSKKGPLKGPRLFRWEGLDSDGALGLATDPRVRAILEWFQAAQVARQPVCMEKLAMAVHMSSSRLCHLFAAQIGIPPCHYTKLLRLHKARKLLEESFLEVKEIAARVGLNDLSHFVRDYKKVYHETPSQTRTKRRLGHWKQAA